MPSRNITLILPYYMNPTMLGLQYDRLAELPENIRENLSLIVCDDGSPQSPAKDVPNEKAHALRSFQLFRVEVDVRWNWLTCRNIGVEHADTRWVLMTDIDHFVPAETAARLIDGELDDRNVYRFSRRDAPDLTPYKPHPNSWFMRRKLFERIGGYDERFSGFYGSDGEFRDRVKVGCKDVVMLDEYLIRVPREVVADASTTTYGRKEKQDGVGVTKARARIAKEGGPPLNRSFPYHLVMKFAGGERVS